MCTPFVHFVYFSAACVSAHYSITYNLTIDWFVAFEFEVSVIQCIIFKILHFGVVFVFFGAIWCHKVDFSNFWKSNFNLFLFSLIKFIFFELLSDANQIWEFKKQITAAKLIIEVFLAVKTNLLLRIIVTWTSFSASL